MFGCCLFTINCNAEVTLPMMTQYMMGMVQSGCWALFDDTDRLTKGIKEKNSIFTKDANIYSNSLYEYSFLFPSLILTLYLLNISNGIAQISVLDWILP